MNSSESAQSSEDRSVLDCVRRRSGYLTRSESKTARHRVSQLYVALKGSHVRGLALSAAVIEVHGLQTGFRRDPPASLRQFNSVLERFGTECSWFFATIVSVCPSAFDLVYQEHSVRINKLSDAQEKFTAVFDVCWAAQVDRKVADLYTR